MTTSDTLQFSYFNPAGLTVRGIHVPTGLPVLSQLQDAHASAHAAWRARVSAKPGGFDGDRAVLIKVRPSDASGHPESLDLTTGYRTYTEGRALHDVLADARKQGFTLSDQQLATPDRELTWGFSLCTTILLPYDHVLCAQRSSKLLVSPGQWLPHFTEVIEPSDMNAVTMAQLLERLVVEEVPPFRQAGAHRFVGLGVRHGSYTWQLASVLDARHSPELVIEAIEKLQPDAETEQWGIAPLTHSAAIAGKLLYPSSIARPAAIDVTLAQYLSERISHARD